MKPVLVVVEAFLDHKRGDVISDLKLVQQYLESEWQNHFVKSRAPADPAPKKK